MLGNVKDRSPEDLVRLERTILQELMQGRHLLIVDLDEQEISTLTDKLAKRDSGFNLVDAATFDSMDEDAVDDLAERSTIIFNVDFTNPKQADALTSFRRANSMKEGLKRVLFLKPGSRQSPPYDHPCYNWTKTIVPE